MHFGRRVHVSRSLQQAFDASEMLRSQPLSEPERTRLVELQAKISEILCV